jgi:hypothetical protein
MMPRVIHNRPENIGFGTFGTGFGGTGGRFGGGLDIASHQLGQRMPLFAQMIRRRIAADE